MELEHRELRAVAIGAAIVAGYAALVLASGKVDSGDFAQLWLTYTKGAFGLWLFVGLIGAIVLLIRFRPVGGATAPSPVVLIALWLLDRWERDKWLSLLWPPLLFSTLMASFNAFKQMILVGATFRFDAAFAAADRALFFGADPWVATHALFGSPTATWFIDKAYHGWFLPMSVGVILCAWLSRRSWRLRTQYLLSYIFVWIGIGSVLAYLLPAAGPCYYPAFAGPAPEFQALIDRLAAIQAAIPDHRLSALNSQAVLLDHYGSNRLAIGAGISAMPSVHNALAVLFALAAFRIARPLGWAMTGYALLIWIGSIHLGWHYAIDGLASALLTVAIWRAMGRVADWLERPGGAAAPTLAPAE